jgi:hypothetical protein
MKITRLTPYNSVNGCQYFRETFRFHFILRGIRSHRNFVTCLKVQGLAINKDLVLLLISVEISTLTKLNITCLLDLKGPDDGAEHSELLGLCTLSIARCSKN